MPNSISNDSDKCQIAADRLAEKPRTIKANFHFAGRMIDGIRINAVSYEMRDGRKVLLKRRRAASHVIIPCANFFFRVSQTPVFVHANLDLWQQWEIECFNLLNGDFGCAKREAHDTITTELLPGKSLADHFDDGTFEERMLDSAADELRRVHQLSYSGFEDGVWSHGDANLANCLYNAETGRCRMIDFELIHQTSLTANERHARDLLTFLQDLAGCISGERWLSASSRFLDRYGRAETLPILKNLLAVPSGIPRLWCWIRANYIAISELKSRMRDLRETL